MNNDRFSWNAGEVGLVLDDGQIVTNSEMQEYLKNKREELLTIKEEMKIGDIVKLKVTNRVVEIIRHNAENSTYRGSLISDKNRIFEFGQEDIEEVVRKK